MAMATVSKPLKRGVSRVGAAMAVDRRLELDDEHIRLMFNSLPETDEEYPDEVVKRWDRESDVAMAEVAAGRRKIYGDVKVMFRDLEIKRGGKR